MGFLPEPDTLYVTLGTMGTAAGLGTKIKAVRVVPEFAANMEKFQILVYKTVDLLHKIDPCFPKIQWDDNDIQFDHDFFGGQYGLDTKESVKAVITARETENLKLEGTYTGKTLAFMIQNKDC